MPHPTTTQQAHRASRPQARKGQPGARNIQRLPLHELTKEEKKKEWKRVLKAGVRSLKDEFVLLARAYDEKDFETLKNYGDFGGHAERLWRPVLAFNKNKNVKSSGLSQTSTRSTRS